MRTFTAATLLTSHLRQSTSFTPSVASFSIQHQRVVHQQTFTSLHQSAATEELKPGIDAINSRNSDLEPLLDNLRESPYFRMYSVDMLGSW